jgi:hypothetical protein
MVSGSRRLALVLSYLSADLKLFARHDLSRAVWRGPGSRNTPASVRAAPMPANFGIAAPEPLSGARCLWEDNGAGPWTERAD